jgi:hypothetical protein
VNVIKMKLQDSNRKVKIQGQLTEAFGIERSLRQGDALSTALYRCTVHSTVEMHCPQHCRNAMSTALYRCTVHSTVEMHCPQHCRDALSTAL